MLKGALGGSGTFDWVMQRLTAVLLAAYLFFGVAALAVLTLRGHSFTYEVWMQWFQPLWMKAPTLLAIAALCVHAWIGIWTVATDYLHGLRLLFLTVGGLMLVGCLGWSVIILWGL